MSRLTGGNWKGIYWEKKHTYMSMLCVMICTVTPLLVPQCWHAVLNDPLERLTLALLGSVGTNKVGVKASLLYADNAESLCDNGYCLHRCLRVLQVMRFRDGYLI